MSEEVQPQNVVEVDTPLSGISEFVDALLRDPAKLLRPASIKTVFSYHNAAILLGCLAFYGVALAMFSGGVQLYKVPTKIILGYLVAGAITFPSFYILTCLTGSRASSQKIAAAFLSGLTLTCLLLAGFVPIIWLFGESTESSLFMGSVHVMIAFFAITCAFKRFSNSLEEDQRVTSGLHTFWRLIFLLTVFQMSTSVRPLFGNPDDETPRDKRFFLQHWNYCFTNENCLPPAPRVITNQNSNGSYVQQ